MSMRAVVGCVVLTVAAPLWAQTPEELELEKKADEYLAKHWVKSLGETCKSEIKVAIDWPSFRAGSHQISGGSDEDSSRQRRAVMLCGQAVNMVSGLCSSKSGLAAVSGHIKTITCELDPNRRAPSQGTHIVNGAAMTVRFNWTATDLEVPIYTEMAIPAQPENDWHMSIAESKQIPEADRQIKNKVEMFNERCSTKLEAGVDWSTFHGLYEGARGPETVVTWLEGPLHAMQQVCDSKEFAKVKKVELINDGSLRVAGPLFDLKDGVITVSMNMRPPRRGPPKKGNPIPELGDQEQEAANVARLKQGFGGFWKYTVLKQPLELRPLSGHWMLGCDRNRGDNKRWCTICGDLPSDIPAHGGRIVSDRTVLGGRYRKGDCWKELRWLDGTPTR